MSYVLIFEFMNIKNINISSLSVTDEKLPRVVRGLNGIMWLFGVSKTTAWKLKRDVIGEACSQHGRIIECDVRRALELFGLAYPDSLVVDETDGSLNSSEVDCPEDCVD